MTRINVPTSSPDGVFPDGSRRYIVVVRPSRYARDVEHHLAAYNESDAVRAALAEHGDKARLVSCVENHEQAFASIGAEHRDRVEWKDNR